MKWIQKIKLKKGILHKQLGIPKDKKIPLTLLNKIISSDTGKNIKNSSKTGKKNIKVTSALKKKANLARNLKKL